MINISRPYRPPRPVTGIAILFSYNIWGRENDVGSSTSHSPRGFHGLHVSQSEQFPRINACDNCSHSSTSRSATTYCLQQWGVRDDTARQRWLLMSCIMWYLMTPYQLCALFIINCNWWWDKYTRLEGEMGEYLKEKILTRKYGLERNKKSAGTMWISSIYLIFSLLLIVYLPLDLFSSKTFGLLHDKCRFFSIICIFLYHHPSQSGSCNFSVTFWACCINL
jgi:hypothetical protein